MPWRELEAKWQRQWAEAKIFEADPDPKRPKFFLTVAYPYPNSPQHIGHGRTYTLADVHARYKRMRGYNVLFPMGFHYTGTPILAMAKRLAENDKDLISTFKDVYSIPPTILDELTEPLRIAKYFHEEIRQGLKDIGYSIDFRREFTTIDSAYKRFIEWQFYTLRNRGLVSQGSHPVGWCPHDGNPVGQHDTRGDVEPEIVDFTLIKFGLEDYVIPTGTLRPETVFGVTNIWIRPEVVYVKALVNHEKWIVSHDAVEKLKHLNRKVDVLESFRGKELLGKYVTNPATNKKVPILPAQFVDPGNVTGVVMSVPSHAPYDLVALEDMKKGFTSSEGISKEVLNEVVPISVIHVEGYSEVPASDTVKKLGIQNQTDSKLEDATREVYRHEFHNGFMKQNTGKYADLMVAKAKEIIRMDLLAEGKAEGIYELANRPVFCRCGTQCVVKLVENQWFLNYGDPSWKTSAHECVNSISILPEEIRTEFTHVIDWLKEKACARKAGLGTKLPWDPQWIIESLSDSTIYMCYYLLAKYINQGKLNPEQLSKSVLDYVLLGEGDYISASKDSGVEPGLLSQMRNEFNYFYPVDARHSGRDLVPNHLTYFVFNHVAIFRHEQWPKGIIVNGSVLMEGQKMSKSFGNITPLRLAIEKYGADPLRISLLGTSGLLQDTDFSTTLARSMVEWLEGLYTHTQKVMSMSRQKFDPNKLATVDKWMLSRVQSHIKNDTQAMETLEGMKACQSALYLFHQDRQWYLRRTSAEDANAERLEVVAAVLYECLDVQTRLLAPFIPHLCEEIWHQMGHESFVSTEQWPIPIESRVDTKSEDEEALLVNLIEDTKNILKVTTIKPQKVVYYTSASWKQQLDQLILKSTLEGEVELKKILNQFQFSSTNKATAANFAKKLLEEIRKTAKDQISRLISTGEIDAREIITSAKRFLEKELRARVEVFSEDSPEIYDPKLRAKLAQPRRPAIYVE